jgi:hypothetical protein
LLFTFNERGASGFPFAPATTGAARDPERLVRDRIVEALLVDRFGETTALFIVDLEAGAEDLIGFFLKRVLFADAVLIQGGGADDADDSIGKCLMSHKSPGLIAIAFGYAIYVVPILRPVNYYHWE